MRNPLNETEMFERIGKLVEALEPFAALADIFDIAAGNRVTGGVICEWTDHRVGTRMLTVEMLHAARDAIAATRLRS